MGIFSARGDLGERSVMAIRRKRKKTGWKKEQQNLRFCPSWSGCRPRALICHLSCHSWDSVAGGGGLGIAWLLSMYVMFFPVGKISFRWLVYSLWQSLVLFSDRWFKMELILFMPLLFIWDQCPGSLLPSQRDHPANPNERASASWVGHSSEYPVTCWRSVWLCSVVSHHHSDPAPVSELWSSCLRPGGGEGTLRAGTSYLAFISGGVNMH